MNRPEGLIERSKTMLAIPRVMGGLPAILAGVVLAAAFGAPMICFEIDVGDATTLPKDAHAIQAANLPSEATKLLRASDDPQLHMETLRRAALAADAATWRALLSTLKDAALANAAQHEPASAAERAARALPWFDLGYAEALGSRMGFDATIGRNWLEKSAELRPDDPALRFGIALALYDASFSGDEASKRDELRRVCYDHLLRALAGDDARLRRNLVATFGAFLGCKTHEQLLAAIRSKARGT
jgi:hypothetical protein